MRDVGAAVQGKKMCAQILMYKENAGVFPLFKENIFICIRIYTCYILKQKQTHTYLENFSTLLTLSGFLETVRGNIQVNASFNISTVLRARGN